MTDRTLDAKSLTEQVRVSNGIARLSQNGQTREYETRELPEKFVRWQLDYKHSIYDAIERAEYEPFHVVKTMYPYSYCFWVYGYKDKTPKRRYPGRRSDNTLNEGHGEVDPSKPEGCR